MKKYVFLTLFIWISNYCFSQTHEIGFFIGGTNYVGDVGKTNYILPNSPGGSLLYKYNLNSRIALRGSFSLFSIKGDDSYSENAIRQARGFSFTNNVNEIALGFEYNFFEYDLSENKNLYTPYVLISVAAFNFEAPEDVVASNYNFIRKTKLAIPIGIGFKTKVYGNLAFAVETSFRYTFTDKLDYPKNITPGPTFNTGSGNDWYMFTGISFVYTFGRPPCYE